MTIKEKLKKYDLFDQSIIRHGILDYIRDYEIIGYLSGFDFDLEIQYIFKGCIKADYKVKVDPANYSMNDALLDIEKQDSLDFPKGFIWGVRYSAVYPGITLTEQSEELEELKHQYGISFSKIHFDTQVYDLTLIFHDLETRELNKINRKG
jgi:hypothetical protein